MIQTICICGAGTMGSGIAQVAAMAGFSTIQYDLSNDMLGNSRRLIEKNLARLQEKGKMSATDAQESLSRITYTNKQSDCIADLIIEAIIEDKNAKTGLFRSLAAINTTETIFATNTSSISVTEIASACDQPGKVIGLHFFNPAPLMKLVEVITTRFTEPGITETIIQLSIALGKVPVTCKDAPGFIVNRVARHYYLEAMRLVELGLADISTIDSVMLSTGFKMGPFALMDLIGMDINYSVSGIVWNALGQPERLKPSELQKAKVAAGELGRKTGSGFYTYNG